MECRCWTERLLDSGPAILALFPFPNPILTHHSLCLCSDQKETVRRTQQKGPWTHPGRALLQLRPVRAQGQGNQAVRHQEHCGTGGGQGYFRGERVPRYESKLPRGHRAGHELDFGSSILVQFLTHFLLQSSILLGCFARI